MVATRRNFRKEAMGPFSASDAGPDASDHSNSDSFDSSSSLTDFAVTSIRDELRSCLANVTHVCSFTSAADMVNEKARVQHILKEWKRSIQTGQPIIKKLFYVLDHKYAEASLSLELLKGRDYSFGICLAEACGRESFVLLLANMTLAIHKGWKEIEDGGLEQKLTLCEVVSTDENVLLHDVKIDAEEIIQADYLNHDPGEVDTEDYGEDYPRYYHDSVGPAIAIPWKTFPADFPRLQS